MSTRNERSERNRLGIGMIAGAWLLVLAMLTVYFSGWLDARRNPNTDVQGRIAEDGSREVVLHQNRQGHYVVNGRINERTVTFLLDTGATTILVPSTLARVLNLPVGPAEVARTANGTIKTHRTRLDRVQIGNIVLRDVRGNISSRAGDQVLLGMSFLRQVDFVQQGDTLTLRQSREP